MTVLLALGHTDSEFQWESPGVIQNQSILVALDRPIVKPISDIS